MAPDTYPRAFLERLADLHAAVDAAAQPVETHLGDTLVCRRGCSSCCQDGLTAFTLEAALIRDAFPDVLTGEPGPEGACAFLSPDGACRIYRVRPYVCRTQGLPLRWVETGPDGDDQEQRDICPLNAQAMADLGRRIVDLDPEECWTLGPWEGRLASLQAEADGRFEVRRVPLRDLFD